MQQSIFIQNVHVVDSNTDCVCDLFIQNGIIQKMGSHLSVQADLVIDGSNLTALPGLFDMHVHLRDPGFTYKEDIITGAAAALAGGVTGLACMPNTKPVIDNPEVVQYILDRAQNTGVKIHPIGCITRNMQGEALCDYAALKQSGICAISDDGKPVEHAGMMLKGLEEAKKHQLPVISHCEDLSIINGGIINEGVVSKRLQVKGMDRTSEDTITAREILLAQRANSHIHIAHVSTKGSVEIVRIAKQHGISVTCETCPHYFLMTEEKVLSRDADYRMSPPLREEEDRIAVLNGVLDGTIDCIVTDHAPHTPEEKADFEKAPNGVIGMETSLAATLKLYHEGKLSLKQIVSMMADRPRSILNLPQVTIQEQAPAELVLVDLNYKWIVNPEKLHSKAKNAVFKGVSLKGKPVMTITDGIIRYQDETYPF